MDLRLNSISIRRATFFYRISEVTTLLSERRTFQLSLSEATSVLPEGRTFHSLISKANVSKEIELSSERQPFTVNFRSKSIAFRTANFSSEGFEVIASLSVRRTFHQSTSEVTELLSKRRTLLLWISERTDLLLKCKQQRRVPRNLHLLSCFV